MREAAPAASVRQFAQPPFEKTLFRFLLREAQGAFVGCSGFRCLTQSPAEIRPCCVRKMVISQLPMRQNGIDKCQSCCWPVAHRHGDSTIQFDHRRGCA